ncbi:MAG: hypothetical protein R6V03_08015, partial [Kiritimatiellia bacterium]
GWCELPPSFAGDGTYPAEDYAFDDDLSEVTFVLRNSPKVLITDNTELGSLDLGSSAVFNLNGFVVTLNDRFTVAGDSQSAGTYTAADFTQVQDSAGGGKIVLLSQGSIFSIK